MDFRGTFRIILGSCLGEFRFFFDVVVTVTYSGRYKRPNNLLGVMLGLFYRSNPG